MLLFFQRHKELNQKQRYCSTHMCLSIPMSRDINLHQENEKYTASPASSGHICHIRIHYSASTLWPSTSSPIQKEKADGESRYFFPRATLTRQGPINYFLENGAKNAARNKKKETRAKYTLTHMCGGRQRLARAIPFRIFARWIKLLPINPARV